MALGNWPKGLVEDRYDFFFEGYDAAPSKIDAVFETKKPTEGSYAQRTSAIAAGKLEQKTSENSSVTFRRPSEAFTAYAVYRDFDDGVELTRNEVDDFPASKTRDLVQSYISDWGRTLKLTEEDYAATLFTKGAFTGGHDNYKNVVPGLLSQNADGLGYDGQPFFSASGNNHTSKGGSTYFNALTTVPLNVTNYETLHDQVFVTNAYNERDERVNTKGMGSVVLLHPPQLRGEAFRAIESEYLPGTDHNDRNPWAKSAKLVEWDALRDNASTWYLGVANMGICFYRRGTPEIRMFRDEDNGSYKATVRARYGWMAYNWRFWGSADAPTS